MNIIKREEYIPSGTAIIDNNFVLKNFQEILKKILQAGLKNFFGIYMLNMILPVYACTCISIYISL